jgi:hypothetical protein
MAELLPHPHSRPGPVRRVGADARRTGESGLALTYVIEGDLSQVRIPPPRPARIGYKLWRHTCCEVFVAVAEAPRYHEFNFSPSGEWCAYAFGAYREGASLDDTTLEPQIAAARSPGRLELSALVDLDKISAKGKLALGLCVVVEQEDGGLSYWALKHPPGRPDFHHRDAFALELA